MEQASIDNDKIRKPVVSSADTSAAFLTTRRRIFSEVLAFFPPSHRTIRLFHYSSGFFRGRFCVCIVAKTMKPIPHSLSLRSLARCHLPSCLPLSTNTASSRPTILSSFTYNHRQLTTMPPPSKRKFRPRGDRSGGAGNGDRNGAPTTPRSTVAQQPKRPRVENTMPISEGTVDIKQMYSMSAGDAEPKKWAEMNGKLDKALLDSLDKMGFE